MFRTLNTLLRGVAAEAEEAVTDRNALTLLDQKIRDTATGVAAAKQSLAGLIKRDRLEEQQLDIITGRIADLAPRVEAAFSAGNEALSRSGATALADLENEASARHATRTTLAGRIDRLRHGLGTATRRLADLRQAATTAHAVDQERRGQRGLSRSGNFTSDIAEAEALVTRILGQDDPFEDAEIMAEIDNTLTGASARDTLAAAGFGKPLRATADSVLARFSTPKPA